MGKEYAKNLDQVLESIIKQVSALSTEMEFVKETALKSSKDITEIEERLDRLSSEDDDY